MNKNYKTMDANEAVSSVSYKFSELCGIYPITPASPMAEKIDVFSNNNELNFDNFNPDNVDYDVHGLQVESIPYSFELDIGSIKGQFIKYLKISLDTDKITKLYEDFGTQIGDAIMKLVPELKVSKLTKDSVVITLSLEKLSTDETEYYCDIYRADSEKGEYEKINSELLKCNDIVGFSDSSLKENTTYYYK